MSRDGEAVGTCVLGALIRLRTAPVQSASERRLNAFLVGPGHREPAHAERGVESLGLRDPGPRRAPLDPLDRPQRRQRFFDRLCLGPGGIACQIDDEEETGS